MSNNWKKLLEKASEQLKHVQNTEIKEQLGKKYEETKKEAEERI